MPVDLHAFKGKMSGILYIEPSGRCPHIYAVIFRATKSGFYPMRFLKGLRLWEDYRRLYRECLWDWLAPYRIEVGPKADSVL